MPNKRKKKYIWFAVLAGLLLIILLSVNYLASTFINLERVKNQLQAAIAQQVDGKVEFQGIDLSIFPLTHVVVHKTDISIPGTAQGSIETLDIYPAIFPLFAGKVLIDEIRIGSPDIKITLTKKVANETATKEPVTKDSINDRVTAALAALASVAPDLTVEINDGSFSLTEEEKTVLKGKSLTGTFHVDKDKTGVSLARLDLDYPRLSMSGKLLIDRKTPAISLELKGKDLDVHSTREAVLALGGDNATVIDIFNILRSGTIPEIAFTTSGSSINDLGKTENIVVRGNLAKGNIHVPGVDLDLEEVRGDVKISKGILKGENLEARMENRTGREGKLTIGLEGDDAPFHLDLLVKANLTQIPPLLKRIVRNKAFINEITRIHNVKGNAEARLTLGESLQSIKTGIDILEINLSADYERIPYPLKIKGGQLSYRESAVGLSNLTGNVGKSSFSGLTANIDFAKDPHLEILSEKSSIVLDELFTWLSSYDKTGDSLKDIKSLKGTVEFSSLNLKGPLLTPETWRFETAGEVSNLFIDTSLLPGPMKVTGGKVKADQDVLEFKDSKINMLDGSLSASGLITDYLSDPHKADLTFHGDIREDFAKWISDRINMPSQLYVQTPLSISQAHLTWDKGTGTSLDGSIIFQKGPRVSIDLLINPEGIMINNLLIEDEASRLSSSLTLKEKELSLDFTGNMTRQTMGNIFMTPLLEKEWIKGDFRLSLKMDAPVKLMAQGQLRGEGLYLPMKLKIPLRIDSISLNGSGDSIIVDNTVLASGDNHISLKGSVSSSDNEFLVDLDAHADNINWDTLHTAFESEKDAEEREHFWDLPLKGTLSLHSDSFTFKQFQWTPLNANISLTPDKINVAVTDATVCNVSSPGELEVTPQYMSLDFKPAAVNQDLDPTTECLFGISRYMTGNFNLQGNVKAKGKSEEIVNLLTGELVFNAKKGRVYQFGVLSKVLAFLNVTEIFRGRPPDFAKEGFAYETVNAKADIQGSTLSLKEFIIDGSSMGIATQGDINLKDQKLDLEVLVAPFKTAGTLVSIPVKVTGDIKNPDISYFSASDNGSGVRGIMKKTFKAPVKIFRPDKKEGEKENNQ
jgi:hypothetical protein